MATALRRPLHEGTDVPAAPTKRIAVSNPYEQKGFLKRMVFHKKAFGGAIDHAFIKTIGEYYVRLLRRDPDRLFSWVEIETINRCNSTCTFCPVNKKDDPRDQAYMSDELFAKIVDELAELGYTGRLALYSNNEPLLDPKIVERVAYAKKRCPAASVYILTNGTKLTTQIALDLLDAGIDYIKIDNYSNKLKLHRNVEQVIEDIERHEGGKYVDRVFVVKRLLNEVLSNRGGSAPNKDASLQKETFQHYESSSCSYPFVQMIIRPTGKVSLCCNDALGKATMGDVSKRSLVQVWRGKAFRELRQNLVTTGRKNMAICDTCDVFTADPDVILEHNAVARVANRVLGLRRKHWK